MTLPPSLSVLALLLAFGLPLVGWYRRSTSETNVDWVRIRRRLVLNWALLLGLVAVVLGAGDAVDLGLRVPPFGRVVDGLLFGFIAFAGTMLLVGFVARSRGGVTADAASLVVFEQSLARRLAVAVTGAVVETTLFFGIVIETLRGLGSGPWMAGVAAVGGVLMMRVQGGRRNALQWLPGAAVLAGIALWTRTALVVLLIRLLYDAITLASADVDDYATPADA